MFLLHYVYTPRINNAIESFCASWNHHPLRTEQNWSPVQIWTNGMADQRNKSLCHVAKLRNFMDNITDLWWYEMDWGPTTPSEDDLSVSASGGIIFAVKRGIVRKIKQNRSASAIRCIWYWYLPFMFRSYSNIWCLGIAFIIWRGWK